MAERVTMDVSGLSPILSGPRTIIVSTSTVCSFVDHLQFYSKNTQSNTKLLLDSCFSILEPFFEPLLPSNTREGSSQENGVLLNFHTKGRRCSRLLADTDLGPNTFSVYTTFKVICSLIQSGLLYSIKIRKKVLTLAQIVRKTLIPTVLCLLYDFLSLKNDVNVPLKSKKAKKTRKNFLFC